jgi:hypothetical protein
MNVVQSSAQPVLINMVATANLAMKEIFVITAVKIYVKMVERIVYIMLKSGLVYIVTPAILVGMEPLTAAVIIPTKMATKTVGRSIVTSVEILQAGINNKNKSGLLTAFIFCLSR